jgi:hypothetical protein
MIVASLMYGLHYYESSIYWLVDGSVLVLKHSILYI